MTSRTETKSMLFRAGAVLAAACVAAIALVSTHATSAFAIATSFSYQGQLKKNGAPYTGSADLTFRLFTASSGGALLGTATRNGVSVTGGLFTTQLDFSASFDGSARWLEISASTPGDGPTTLTPRQEITSVPYALRATFAESGAGGGSQWITSGSSISYNVGNVGIGTSSPTTKLHVASGTADINTAYFESSNAAFPCFFTRNWAPNGWGHFDDASARHHLTGSLGIGTTTMEAKLHVVNTLGMGLKVQGKPDGPTGGAAIQGIGDGSVFVGPCTGVQGTTDYGNGLEGITSSSSWYGGYFDNTGGGTALFCDGLADVRSLRILGGADIVEGFDARDDADADGKPEPGDVLVIDDARAGELITSRRPYDSKVAGVVSGANGISHGMKLGQDGVLDGETLVAMTGRVYVKCSTENGAIRPGDLLTTSATSGHAMRATDRDRANGAVIGKAMSTLDARTGLVLVLVNLQ